MKPSLKSFLADNLNAQKIISYEDLVKLAREYGAKTSTAERRLRKGEAWDLPVQKLNKDKKPIKDGDYIAYYKYIGGSIWKPKNAKRVQRLRQKQGQRPK